MTGLSSYETKKYFLPHLMIKKGVGVSDSDVMLTLSMATWVWIAPLNEILMAQQVHHQEHF